MLGMSKFDIRKLCIVIGLIAVLFIVAESMSAPSGEYRDPSLYPYVTDSEGNI